MAVELLLGTQPAGTQERPDAWTSPDASLPSGLCAFVLKERTLRLGVPELHLRSSMDVGSRRAPTLPLQQLGLSVDRFSRIWPSDALALSVSHQGSDLGK